MYGGSTLGGCLSATMVAVTDCDCTNRGETSSSRQDQQSHDVYGDAFSEISRNCSAHPRGDDNPIKLPPTKHSHAIPPPLSIETGKSRGADDFCSRVVPVSRTARRTSAPRGFRSRCDCGLAAHRQEVSSLLRLLVSFVFLVSTQVHSSDLNSRLFSGSHEIASAVQIGTYDSHGAVRQLRKNKSPRRPFGTIDGYDTQGGTNPICWHTAVNDSKNATVFDRNNSTFVSLEDLKTRFPWTESEGARIKDTCWKGFDMEIIPPSDCTDGKLCVLGVPHNFQVTVTVTQLRYSKDDYGGEEEWNLRDWDTFPQIITPANKVWVRLIVCDATKIGFCTPFQLTSDFPAASTESDGAAKETGKKADISYGVRRRERRRTLTNEEAKKSKQKTQNTESGDEIASRRNLIRDGHYSSEFIGLDLSPPVEAVKNKTEDEDHSVVEVVPAEAVKDGFDESFTTQSVTLNMTLRLDFLETDERVPTSFFVIGHATMFASSFSSYEAIRTRVDMANSVPKHLIMFQPPPLIRTIRRRFRAATAVFVGVCVLFQLFLLGSILKHRQHTVMKLSQAPFLAILVLMSILGSAGCILIVPTNTMICNARDPVIILPCVTVAAIMVGRLWRLHAVLAPTMRLGTVDSASPIIKKAERTAKLLAWLDMLASWHTLCGVCEPKQQSQRESMRRRKGRGRPVSSAELLRLVVLLIFPEIVVVIWKSIFFQESYEEVVNKDQTEGVIRCVRPVGWPVLVGYIYIGLLCGVTVAIAHLLREMPSLFNETSDIFKTAWSISLILAFGLSVLILTHENVSPEVPSFILMAIILSNLFFTGWFVVLPKLRLIWSGQHVVVSSFLGGVREDAEVVRRASMTLDLPGRRPSVGASSNSSDCLGGRRVTSAVVVPNGDEPRDSSDPEERRDESFPAEAELDAAAARIAALFKGDDEDDDDDNDDNGVGGGGGGDGEGETVAASTVDESKESSSQRGGVFSGEVSLSSTTFDNSGRVGRSGGVALTTRRRRRRSSARGRLGTGQHSVITIREDEPLPRAFEQQIYNSRELLMRVSNRLMIGVQVPKADWQQLRMQGVEFGEACDRVAFDWETDGTHRIDE